MSPSRWPPPGCQKLIADTAAQGAPPARQLALRVMARSHLRHLPASWLSPIAASLRGDDATLRDLAVAAVRAVPLPGEGAGDLAAALVTVGAREGNPPALRLAALAVLPAGSSAASTQVFDFLRSQLAEGVPAMTQSLAADAVARGETQSRPAARTRRLIALLKATRW